MQELLKSSIPLIIAVGIPSLMVLVGILSNKQDITRLSSEIRDLRTDFNAAQRQHHEDILRVHGDIFMLVQRDTDTQTRISRLEEHSS